MTSVETHFRELVIRERLQALHGELAVIYDSVNDNAHLHALGQACWHLRKAAEELRNAPSVLDLRTQLELSICTWSKAPIAAQPR